MLPNRLGDFTPDRLGNRLLLNSRYSIWISHVLIIGL